AMAAFWRGATSRRAIFLGARYARRPQHCASAGGNGSSGVVRSVGRTFARLGRHRHAQAIRPPPELDLRREPVRDLRRDRISRAGRQHRRREVGSPASGPQAAHPGCAWITAFTGQSSARAVEMFSGLNWLARVQRLEPVNATLTGQSTCLFNGFANNSGEVTIDRLTLRIRKLSIQSMLSNPAPGSDRLPESAALPTPSCSPRVPAHWTKSGLCFPWAAMVGPTGPVYGNPVSRRVAGPRPVTNANPSSSRNRMRFT